TGSAPKRRLSRWTSGDRSAKASRGSAPRTPSAVLPSPASAPIRSRTGPTEVRAGRRQLATSRTATSLSAARPPGPPVAGTVERAGTPVVIGVLPTLRRRCRRPIHAFSVQHAQGQMSRLVHIRTRATRPGGMGRRPSDAESGGSACRGGGQVLDPGGGRGNAGRRLNPGHQFVSGQAWRRLSPVHLGEQGGVGFAAPALREYAEVHRVEAEGVEEVGHLLLGGRVVAGYRQRGAVRGAGRA